MPDTQERRVDEAAGEMNGAADEMQEQSERLGDHIAEARSTWERTQQDDLVARGTSEWEDEEPVEEGEDPAGFDDPESLDLDDEDLDDEEVANLDREEP